MGLVIIYQLGGGIFGVSWFLGGTEGGGESVLANRV